MSCTKSYILNQYSTLIKYQSSFLEIESLKSFSITCRRVNEDLKDQLKQAKAAVQLLDHVLNINEKRKEEILKLIAMQPAPGSTSMILIRTHGKIRHFNADQDLAQENSFFGRLYNYFNKKPDRNKMNNVSSFEAAAHCGDFHLIKIFIAALPANQTYEAGLQLQEVLIRSDFLYAFYNVQVAYTEYNRYYQELRTRHTINRNGVEHFEIRTITSEEIMHIDNLMEQIGEEQKGLSNFGLQAFCDFLKADKNLKIHPDYTKDPNRNCRWWDGSDIRLEQIGVGTKHMIYQFNGARPNHIFVGAGVIHHYILDDDTKNFDMLCKLIQSELNSAKTKLLGEKRTKLKGKSV